MKWKLFAVAMVILFVIGVVDHYRDTFDWISLPISAAAVIGLVAYAFRVDRLGTSWWGPVGWIFVTWTLIATAIGIHRGTTEGTPLYAIAGAVLVALALAYPNWLALRRLGRAEYA